VPKVGIDQNDLTDPVGRAQRKVDGVRARRVVGDPTWPSSSESSTARSSLWLPRAVEGKPARRGPSGHSRANRPPPPGGAPAADPPDRKYASRQGNRALPPERGLPPRNPLREAGRRSADTIWDSAVTDDGIGLGHERVLHCQPAARSAGCDEGAPWMFMWPSSRRNPKRGVILTRKFITNFHLRP